MDNNINCIRFDSSNAITPNAPKNTSRLWGWVFRIIGSKPPETIPLEERSISQVDDSFKRVTTKDLQKAQSLSDYHQKLVVCFSRKPVEAVTQQSEEDFLAGISGKKDLKAQKEQIVKDLGRSLPIYLEGKDLREIAKNANGGYDVSQLDNIFSGEKEKLASLLNQRILVSNYGKACLDFNHDSLNITVMQLGDGELEQVAARLYSSEKAQKDFIDHSSHVHASFDENRKVLFNSKQVVEVSNYGTEKRTFAYFFIHTHYEKGELTTTYEKIYIPPKPLNEAETEDEYREALKILLEQPLILEKIRDENAFLNEINQTQTFEVHKAQIEKELEVNDFPIYLEGKLLSDLIKTNSLDTILEGNKAKAAGLLHRAAFFSYESLCDIFTNPELNIHVQPKIDSDSCRLDVSFDQKGNIIFNSQQLVEVGNFGEQKTSYLSVHTKYENEHQTITVEKVV